MATNGTSPKLTAKKRALFLRELAECGNVTHAARAAGYSKRWMLQLRAQDAEFSAAWDDALDEAAEVLERAAWRRAHDGVEEPIVSMGKLVRNDDGTPLTVRKYSDSLMQFLLRGMLPQKYRDNVNVTAQATTLGITVVLEQMRDNPRIADTAADFVGLLDAAGEAQG